MVDPGSAACADNKASGASARFIVGARGGDAQPRVAPRGADDEFSIDNHEDFSCDELSGPSKCIGGFGFGEGETKSVSTACSVISRATGAKKSHDSSVESSGESQSQSLLDPSNSAAPSISREDPPEGRRWSEMFNTEDEDFYVHPAPDQTDMVASVASRGRGEDEREDETLAEKNKKIVRGKRGQHGTKPNNANANDLRLFSLKNARISTFLS